MDQKIDDLKKEYLNATPPMDTAEGFADVLLRLEKKEEIPFYKSRYLYAGIVAVVAVFLSSVFFFPQNPAATAVKAATQTLYNSLVPPTVSPVSTGSTEVIEKQSPPASPQPSSIITPVPSDEKPSRNKQVADEARSQNPSINNEKVKGVSDSKKETDTPSSQNAPSSPGKPEHANENSQTTGNGTANPSTERSNNGKREGKGN